MLNQLIEVVKFKDGHPIAKKEMTLEQSKLLKPAKGVYYKNYQLGFSQFKEFKN